MLKHSRLLNWLSTLVELTLVWTVIYVLYAYIAYDLVIVQNMYRSLGAELPLPQRTLLEGFPSAFYVVGAIFGIEVIARWRVTRAGPALKLAMFRYWQSARRLILACCAILAILLVQTLHTSLIAQLSFNNEKIYQRLREVRKGSGATQRDERWPRNAFLTP